MILRFDLDENASQQTPKATRASCRRSGVCERRGWKAVPELIDIASGAERGRTGLDELMGLVRKGKVDVIVVFKLDRLGRSLAHLAQLIVEFQAHRVALICTSQGIDTTNQNPAVQL